MFLEEIKIDRYGPISFQKSIHLTPFTLFFGQNEAGKSLTIDAFVKFLLAKDSSNFDKINRVDEFPHGFLIVNVEGEKIKLPEKGLLKKSSEINLEVNDFKNVFIVRSSNLEIDNSSNFFLEVTERLTGIKASVIDEIVNKIREITNLTPHNSFRDIKPFQLKTRIEKADKIIRDIDIMSDDLRSQDFDWLVQKLVGDEEKLMDINNKLSDLNNAKFRDEYNKAILALDDLVRVKKELEDYSEIKEDIKERWYDLIKDRRRINIENENDINKLEALKVEINHLKDEFNNSNNDFIILSNRLNEINRIKPHISELAEKDSNVEKIKDRKNKIFKFLAYVSVIFLVMMTISSVFFHTFIPLILSIAFLIFSLVGYFIYPLKKSKIKKLSRKLRNDLAKYGVNSDSDDVKDIEFSVQKFEEYLNMKKREIDRYQNEIEVKQKLYEEIERKINENRRRINEIDEDIESLKYKYKVNDYDEFCKKLDKKKELYNKLVINQNFLRKSFFTTRNEKIESKMGDSITENDFLYWKNKIKDLEKYKDLATNVEYDQAEYESLLKERERIVNEIDILKRKIEEQKSQMKNLEIEVNNILHTGSDYLHLSKLSDLEAAKELLDNFIKTNNRRKRLAIYAINIFDEIKKKKREEITELFSNNSDVSDLYREISGGKYREVIYNSDESAIIVKDKNGVLLNIDKLSSGAFDQLYFSIRVALAKKLLGNSPGFFIMDDPFIRSDKQRLIRQLKTLENIVKLGWQILYFSAKDEVKDLIQNILDDVDFSILEMNSVVL